MYIYISFSYPNSPAMPISIKKLNCSRYILVWETNMEIIRWDSDGCGWDKGKMHNFWKVWPTKPMVCLDKL